MQLKPLPLIFVWSILLLPASGCVSNSTPTEPLTATQPLDTSASADDANTIDNLGQNDEIASADDDEIDESAEVEDQEFCRDNIYAQYLAKKYLSEHAKAVNPEKPFKVTSRKSRRNRVATRSPYDAREIEALFYARSRLIGENAPYFGAIPVVNHARVEHWIRFFKNNGRKAFLRWMVRFESVRDAVVPILTEQGLPPEFIFLSMVESGFSNSAYSRAKATGPWQFIPGTAKLYGLEMNMWVDERRDPAKSTLAAARHLRDLYAEFGDWYLAMAAYNAGPGRVRSGMRKSGSSDFWAIADSPYMPVETKNYVPKVLAALTLASNPTAHGFNVIADPLDMLPPDTIAVKEPASLAEIAEKLQVSERMIRHWNPELINAITPPSRDKKPYHLRVSSEAAAKWADVEPTLNYVQVKDVLMHRIRPGETIAMIAARYRVDVKRIVSLNPGLKPSRLRVGSEVAVPVAMVQQKVKSSKKSASLTNRRKA